MVTMQMITSCLLATGLALCPTPTPAPATEAGDLHTQMMRATGSKLGTGTS